jgi:hypothetical protein
MTVLSKHNNGTDLRRDDNALTRFVQKLLWQQQDGCAGNQNKHGESKRTADGGWRTAILSLLPKLN